LSDYTFKNSRLVSKPSKSSVWEVDSTHRCGAYFSVRDRPSIEAMCLNVGFEEFRRKFNIERGVCSIQNTQEAKTVSDIPIREKYPQKETRSAEAELNRMYMSIQAPARRLEDLFAAGYNNVFLVQLFPTHHISIQFRKKSSS
jgi:hypothetical protein